MAKITVDQDDLAHLLTAMADTLSGYGPRDFAAGWREAAARLATDLRAEGVDDETTWNEFTGGDE